MQKAPYVFPIIGGRKVEHLMSNIEALDITLTPEQIAYIESVTPAPRGFPHDFIVRYSSFALSCFPLTSLFALQGSSDTDYNFIFKTSGHYDKWPAQEAIRPAKAQ